MQKWMDLFLAANLLAASFRRAEGVAGTAQSDSRSLVRYAIIAAGGCVLAAALAAGIYFWRGDVEGLTKSQSSAVPEEIEEPARVQQSYIDQISLEADVAARSVAVTSSFRGAEIVLFGAIDDTKSAWSSDSPYDVIVAIEGREEPIVMRKKSNVGGIWINTQSARFEHVPSFYAVQSTRPLEEIADSALYRKHRIGIENILTRPTTNGAPLSQAEAKAYTDALLRLKRENKLYVEQEGGVSFTGRVLFRASIDLPPSVAVGTLVARVYLFRDRALLASYTSNIRMERQGLMRYMHQLAFTHQLLYGVLAVLLAAMAGIGASAVFRKAGH